MDNKNKKKPLIGEATAEQIAAWKKQYESVFALEIDERVCYLRKPDRKTLGAATSIAQADPLKFNEIVLENCWLGGCEEIKQDDTLFFSIGAKLAELIEVKTAEIKKL